MSLFAVLRNRKDCRHEIESVLHRNYYPKPGHGTAMSSISCLSATGIDMNRWCQRFMEYTVKNSTSSSKL